MTPEPTYCNEKDGSEMVLIPAGCAVFGSADDDPDAEYDEKPQFKAELSDYYLGIYCVTNAQYARFLSEVRPRRRYLERWLLPNADCHVVSWGGGYAVDDESYEDHPVVHVTWRGAEAYCEWAGLRLPTELEWEKGARGPNGLKYPWGDEWDETLCRHSGNRGWERTCRVYDYAHGCSVYGLYNMSGNVNEWCADWYDGDVYNRYASGDLNPPSTGKDRVLRGGSWGGDPVRSCRSANRRRYGPRRYFVGSIVGERGGIVREPGGSGYGGFRVAKG